MVVSLAVSRQAPGPRPRPPRPSTGRREATARLGAAEGSSGARPLHGCANLSYTCLHRRSPHRSHDPHRPPPSPNRPLLRRGSPMAVTAGTPIELVQQVYSTLPDRVAIAAPPARPTADPGREGPRQPPRRPRGPGARARPQLRRLPPGPRGHAGRHRPDGAPAVHDRRPARGGGALDRPLRPPHPGQGRRRHRPALRARRQLARSTSSCARCRPSTASGSGSRAAASSTRSSWRTTPSRAG